MKTNLLTCLRAALFAAALGLQSNAAIAATGSASELLEKGIYTEETKGDVEAAIAIYQQLIADSKSAQSLAAQAQFRLAQCYLKKSRSAEATAAFEKLVRDFPNEKELIAKAREHLPNDLALGPVPWRDGERLDLALTLASGVEIGAVIYRADLVESDGRKVWRVGGRMSAGAQSASTVDADAETFRPLASHWKHQLLGEASAVYRAGEVEVQKTGAAQPTIIPFDKTAYDNEQTMLVMRRLPLQVGYKTTVPIIATLGASTVLPIGLEVTARETVEVPAGKFECFKVHLNIGQTFWFSDDEHRYLVKFDAGGASALLSAITHQQPGSPVEFRSDALGISLTAPAGWAIHQPRTENGSKKQAINFLDPGADAEEVSLRLRATESITAAVRGTPRAWAESDFKEHLSKHFKDARIRPESWKNYSVAGRVGVSFVGEGTDKGKPMVFFGVYALGPKTSEQFGMACAADKFDALKPAFESIVSSYRTK